MYFRCYIILFIFILTWSCSSDLPRRILVIHSYEESYSAYPDFDKMIARQFQKEGIKADIRTFYLDCEEYHEQPEIERIWRMLDSLSSWKPEIILVNEDQATYSLLKTDHPLLKEISIVFAGVNYPNWELINKYPNVTGFHDKIDFLENIRVARELSEDKDLVFTILDATFLDRQIRADFEKQFENTNIYVCADSMKRNEIEAKIAEGFILFQTLAVRSRQFGAGFLWNLSKFSNYPYLQLKRDFTTINVSAIASTYCISAINESFGYDENILGGYMTTLPIQVEEEVNAAVQILKGKRPSELPITESSKEYVVDWRVIQAKRIPREFISSKYKFINMPFYDRYPMEFFLGMVALVSLIVLLFSWLIFLYRREAKRKRQVLNELEREREALALAIQGGNIYAWSLKGGLMEFENSFWASLCMPPKALSLVEVATFIHPDYRKIFDLHMQNFYHTGKHSVELQCDFNNKGYQWWELRYSTVFDLNGIPKTAGLLINIKDFKRREQELIEARELAEKAELKQSFLANMSHEIRTPLNAIVGFSNILATTEEIEEDNRKQYIDIINTNSELLLKLINDILELSRIESGYMSFKYEKCSVRELVHEIYSTHKMLVPGYLQFLEEIDTKDCQIWADRGRLTQVLTNFLNNAGKFTVEGYIKIGYYCLTGTQEVHIYVEDSGKGITKAEQKMIFSRFYKQDEFAQGAGLGLAICKVIIEKLNGRIELWSEVGKGSRFSIILPIV